MEIDSLVKVISSSMGLVLAVVGLIIAFLTYARRGRLKVGQFEVEFNPREAVQKEANRLIHQLGDETKGLDPAERQYKLLSEYHAQGLAQSKISFWFSLVFASIGFIVIIVTLLTMDRSIAVTEQGKTFVGLIAGTIIEAVSALFFVQSNKARLLMVEFFDRLRTDRKFDESLKIAETISDQEVQSRLKVLLSLDFAGVKSGDTIVTQVFNASASNPSHSKKEIPVNTQPGTQADAEELGGAGAASLGGGAA